MGASPLYPLFISVFFLGLSALGRNYLESSQTTSETSAYVRVQAGTFLRYREVITNYAAADPSFTGTVPSTVLSTQGISNELQAQFQHQVLNATGGRQILVYGALPGMGIEAFNQAEADASIGTANGTVFVPFHKNGVQTGLPISLANGTVVSFIQLGI